MESQLANTKTITADLREFLKLLHGEIDAKLLHRRKVMLMEIINYVNRHNRKTYDQNKELLIFRYNLFK